MLRNYFLTSLRNLLKNKLFSLINIIGLAVGMSVCMFIIVILTDLNSYDNFHSDADRIYRVICDRTSRNSSSFATSPPPLYEELTKNYPGIEKAARLRAFFGGEVDHNDKIIPIGATFADPDFLTIFNFPLSNGNSGNLLRDPYSIVLTPLVCERFGWENKEALGQIINLKGIGNFTVTGVLEELPNNTHFKFESLISFSTVALLEQSEKIHKSSNKWNDTNGQFTYLKLEKKTNPKSFDDAFTSISEQQYASMENYRLDFRLQGLSSITPAEFLENEMKFTMPMIAVFFLSVLAIIILLIACFNYTGLSVARALSRAREVGIRKVAGAQKSQIFLQFICESVLVALFAVGFSWALLEVVIIPQFKTLIFNDVLRLGEGVHLSVYLYFILFSVVSGIIAGAFPAYYLSKFQPVSVLKRLTNIRVLSKLGLRKSLIVVQFSLSLIFIISVTLLMDQTRFMLESDYGFNKENLVNIQLGDVDYETFRTELLRHPDITKVSASNLPPASGMNSATLFTRAGQEPSQTHQIFIDANFIDNFELNVIAGREFRKEKVSEEETEIIISEKALSQLGFESPQQALGESIIIDANEEGKGRQVQVIGVIKDFHYREMTAEIGNLILRHNTGQHRLANVRIESDDLAGVLTIIEEEWKLIDPLHPFDYSFQDDKMGVIIKVFKDVMKIIGFVSFIAIVLACLGLLGMATFQAETRVKEIGIRKILGASVEKLIILLSSSYLWLMGIAIVIAVPAVYFISQLWMENIAFTVELSFWHFGLGIGIMLILGAIMVGSQAFRAARSNPVKALRNE